MLTRRQLEDLSKCGYIHCANCSCAPICEGVEMKSAQTALALVDMLEEITDTLDTVTDIIDESGEWGNINAQTTLETLGKAQTLLKGLEGSE